MDFVIYRRASIGAAVLEIDALLEVKFNYSTQIGELAPRFSGAVRQARGYAKRVNAQSAYVLYLVTWFPLPVTGRPGTPRDAGWKYATSGRTSLVEGADLLDETADATKGASRVGRFVGQKLSATLYHVGGR